MMTTEQVVLVLLYLVYLVGAVTIIRTVGRWLSKMKSKLWDTLDD